MKGAVMKHLLLTALLGTALVAPSTFASDKKTEQLSKEHESLFASLEHLQVDFSQKIFTSLRKKTRMRQGKASFSKPGNFYWVFTDEKGAPVEEYFYDGATLSHYVVADKAVTHYGTRSGLQQELEAIVHLVLDAQKLLNQYQVTDTRKDGDLTRMKLVPRKANESDISGIEVAMAANPKYVKEVKIDYVNGNQTSFTFSHPVTKPIPADRYRFVNPGGVKVNRMG